MEETKIQSSAPAAETKPEEKKKKVDWTVSHLLKNYPFQFRWSDLTLGEGNIKMQSSLSLPRQEKKVTLLFQLLQTKSKVRYLTTSLTQILVWTAKRLRVRDKEIDIEITRPTEDELYLQKEKVGKLPVYAEDHVLNTSSALEKIKKNVKVVTAVCFSNGNVIRVFAGFNDGLIVWHQDLKQFEEKVIVQEQKDREEKDQKIQK